MLATKCLRNGLVLKSQAKRPFTTSISEIHKLDAQLKRKLNVLKMVTEDAEFTYEPPEMIYDKSTGDVTILPKKIKKRGTMI